MVTPTSVKITLHNHNLRIHEHHVVSLTCNYNEIIKYILYDCVILDNMRNGIVHVCMMLDGRVHLAGESGT